MMTSQILKSVDFTKTQNCRYLKNETLFYLQIKKKSLITHQGLLYCKNSFVTQVTPIFGFTEYYFIIEIFKKNWEKIKKN